MSSISPSALHLPHLKPHDNFGGMLSSDKLKAYASFDASNDENDNWDDNYEGDLMTIKGPHHRMQEQDSQELETIRPYHPEQLAKIGTRANPASRNPARREPSHPLQRPRSPVKSQAASRFALPLRPTSMYREKTVEDYSDLFVDSDNVFEKSIGVMKVSDLPISEAVILTSD